MTRKLTVRERDRLRIGGPPPCVTGGDATNLARLAPMLPVGAVAWEHCGIRLGPFCGMMRVGELTLEILPKVAGDTGADARGVLIAMLRAAGELMPDSVGSAGLALQKLHLLDVFILDFCARVNGLLRRGAIRRYDPREENLATVRGRLHFAEDARRNTFDRSRMFCRYDELSPDNAHNRALKFVLGRLLGRAMGAEAKASVNGLLRRMEEVGSRPCTAVDMERLPFDRLTRPWRPVFHRAAWLLRGLHPDVRAVEAEGACLLFDMERLFEAFVGAVLRRRWNGSDARVVLQGPIRPFALGFKGPAFRMRPDVAVVGPDGQATLIADAKWKRLDLRVAGSGVAREDMYQMAGYAGRYRCRDLALLFPSGDGVPPGMVETFTLQDGFGARVRVFALDVAALARGGAPPEALCPRTAPA